MVTVKNDKGVALLCCR